MPRLDKERENELSPKRMEYAKIKLQELGIDISSESETCLWFHFKGSRIQFFPYSGWHTGKTIKDGRGIEKLLKQLKP